jgi:hypothetical protein
MENPARNDAMLHKRETKSKGEFRGYKKQGWLNVKGRLNKLAFLLLATVWAC